MKPRHAAVGLWFGLLLPLAAIPAAPVDPTAPVKPGHPAGPAAGATGGWVLHSTLVNNERRIAVINGQSVREGESIAGARVARIQADEVLLDTPERRIRLRLFSNPLAIQRPRVTP